MNIKTTEKIEIMEQGGRILASAIRALEKAVKPGISTQDLEDLAEKLIREADAKPSFKGYQGYPACLCTSINEEIVHFVPSSKRFLKEGDIISLDLGVLYKDYHTDMAITVPVGKTSAEASKLIQVTKECLEEAMIQIKPGNAFGDIGYAVQNHAESQGFNVVRELCGHGIGKKIHEDPQILNYGKKGTSLELKEGMVFCVEPMISAGDWRIKKSEKDKFGYETADGSLSAHFEHTILVTNDGSIALTR